jgi:dTMP kinase
VLVRPAQGRLAREVLRTLGYVEIRNVEEPGKFLFRRFHDGRCVSAIHVHEWVAWFVGFMDEAALWARMRPAADDPLVNLPSPEDAILINLAHACYENKVLRLNDVLRVRHALRSTGGKPDWAYMERVAASRGWLDGLCFMLLVFACVEEALFGATQISRPQLAHLEQIVRPSRPIWQRLQQIRAGTLNDFPIDLSYWFCKRLYYAKILADPVRSRRERWRDVALTLIWGVRLKSHVRPQSGMLISLSGPDGAGKTAHAGALVDALRLCELQASYLWTRGGSSGLLGIVNRLSARLRTAKSRRGGPAGSPDAHQARTVADAADAITRRRRRLQNPILRLVWSWAVAADQVATYLTRAYFPSCLGRIVVCDRYAYDTAVEMEASLPADATWSRRAIRAMLALTPRPHLAYVLDVSPVTAQARKAGEIWHVDVEHERRRFQALAAQLQLQLLSTEGDFARSNDVLIHDVITHYMAGYETWLNALFFYNPSQKNPPDPVWLHGPARLEAAS